MDSRIGRHNGSRRPGAGGRCPADRPAARCRGWRRPIRPAAAPAAWPAPGRSADRPDTGRRPPGESGGPVRATRLARPLPSSAAWSPSSGMPAVGPPCRRWPIPPASLPPRRPSEGNAPAVRSAGRLRPRARRWQRRFFPPGPSGGGHAWVRIIGRDRAEIDNCAFPLDKPGKSRWVRVTSPVILVSIIVCQSSRLACCAGAVPSQAGIVDQDVDPSKQSGSADKAASIAAASRTSKTRCDNPFRTKLFHERAQPVGTATCGNNLPTSLSEAHCHGLAESRSCAGDHDCLGHHCSFFIFPLSLTPHHLQGGRDTMCLRMGQARRDAGRPAAGARWGR